jgi:glycine/D-amino acid oxidase-like deaminating enzyme
MAMQDCFDVIVIGSGAVGLSIAYELVQAALKVALISPRDTTGVASWAAGAMIDTFGELDRLESDYDRQKLALKLKAQRHYPQWLQDIQDRSGHSIFHRLGLFIVANAGGDSPAETLRERDRAKLAFIQAQMPQYEEPWERVNPHEIPGFEPHADFACQDALFMPQALTVDITDLLPALETAIQNSGFYTRLEDRAIALTPLYDHWQATTQNHGTCTGGKVVVCAGAYTMQLLGEPLRLQAKLPPLYFGQGSSCTMTQGPALSYGIRTPNRSGAASVHLVPRTHDRLYLGANNWFGTDLDQVQNPTIGDIHSLLQAGINQLSMACSQASLESFAWGLRPITPNDRPLVGETALPGLFVATGTHRTGIHLAPILSQLIVAELLDPTSKQSNPFSPRSRSVSAGESSVEA